MGFHDNEERTVEAVLTNKGRKILSKGEGDFNITKFAVSDEGVDYTLYNPDHPSGSEYYAEEITNMPLIEAIPDETNIMKHKLVTLPRDATTMPRVTTSISSITVDQISFEQTIDVQTVAEVSGFDNETYGYTAILSHKKLGSITATQVAKNQDAWEGSSEIEDILGNQSEAVVGTQFKFTGPDAPLMEGSTPSTYQGKILIIGNETGGQAEISVVVDDNELITSI